MPVQLLLELEPNLLVQNMIELEFELSRMQMKRPIGRKCLPANSFSSSRQKNISLRFDESYWSGEKTLRPSIEAARPTRHSWVSGPCVWLRQRRRHGGITAVEWWERKMAADMYRRA